MTIASFLLIVFFIASLGWILISVQPQKLAAAIRMIIPVVMIVSGGLLMLVGRGGIGLPLAGFGLALFARMRSVSKIGNRAGSTSSVRSAALEMGLDHDTGEMDGVVLAGGFEGKSLSSLDEEELIMLLLELQTDVESVQLLEAYLDRRIPGWREDTDGDFGSGHVATPRSGSMSKQEAYEILGLDPGVGASEIRKAHRRLMKGMHPDSGGSTFLAAKINEAKEVLLNGHI